jgi:hypothetical protein
MRLFSLLQSIIWRHMGNCTACTAKAFLAASVAWLLSIFATGEAWTVSTVLAAALTTLWLTHVIVYAKKTVVSADSEATSVVLARRRALLLAKAIGVAAVGSAISSKVFAMGSCGSCGTLRNDWQCWRDGLDGQCYRCRSCGSNCGEYVC